MAPNSPPTRYRADIDGLRAVAVLLVVFYHLDLGVSGGFVGVDVFFVISGYLITGLITAEMEGGRFSFLSFWERRIRRLLPALAVVVISCLVAGCFLFLPQDYKALGLSSVAQSTLLSNFYFWRDASYFSEGNDCKPLLHTWSLAVEEQFYLLFPFLLLGLTRFCKRHLDWALLVLAAISFGISLYCNFSHRPTFNFYLLPTRTWELLMGAVLVVGTKWNVPVGPRAEWLGATGLLAILLPAFLYDHRTVFPGVTAFLPCAGAALILWTNREAGTWVGKMLASPGLVFVGLISYPLYLWHWPLRAFYRYWFYDSFVWWEKMSLLGVSLVLAVLSWEFLEKPFRRRLILKQRRQIFAFALGINVLIVVVVYGIYRLEGVPSRISASAPHPPPIELDDIYYREVNLSDLRSGHYPRLGKENGGNKADVVLWGDSHAKVVYPVINALCGENSLGGMAAVHSATAPLLRYESPSEFSLRGESIAFNNEVLKFVQIHKVPLVILAGAWNHIIDESSLETVRRAFLETIRALKQTGARVLVVRQIPELKWDVRHPLALCAFQGRDPLKLSATPRTEQEEQNLLFQNLAEEGVQILDPAPYFMDAQKQIRIVEGGKSLYFDSHHLSLTGALRLRPLFEPYFSTRNPVTP